jgi:hypothetical protein
MNFDPEMEAKLRRAAENVHIKEEDDRADFVIHGLGGLRVSSMYGPYLEAVERELRGEPHPPKIFPGISQWQARKLNRKYNLERKAWLHSHGKPYVPRRHEYIVPLWEVFLTAALSMLYHIALLIIIVSPAVVVIYGFE